MATSCYVVKGKCFVYVGISNEDADMDTDWQARVKGLLKAELKRRNVSYKELVDRLAKVGVKETEPNIRTKISRGGFTAVFFVQCLVAIGCSTLRLESD
jgi:Domain of unknown function (DUF6471)